MRLAPRPPARRRYKFSAHTVPTAAEVASTYADLTPARQLSAARTIARLTETGQLSEPRQPSPPIAFLDVVVALLDPEVSSVPGFLRLAAADIQTLLQDGVDTGNPLGEVSIGRAAGRIATRRNPAYHSAAETLDEWAAGAALTVSPETLALVLTEERTAAFALGAVLGIRLGGGAR